MQMYFFGIQQFLGTLKGTARSASTGTSKFMWRNFGEDK
jgi:hypothetical protein